MFVFAFPGMGKTTLAQKYEEVVDLEMSDIKYDNSSVSHLSREARKSTMGIPSGRLRTRITRRPILLRLLLFMKKAKGCWWR